VPIKSPSYTQFPNEILDSLHELKGGELKVISVIVRYSLGFHRQKTKPLSVPKLMKLTGLSDQGVTNAIKPLLKRDWVERGRTKEGSVFRLKLKYDDDDSGDTPETETPEAETPEGGPKKLGSTPPEGAKFFGPTINKSISKETLPKESASAPESGEGDVDHQPGTGSPGKGTGDIQRFEEQFQPGARSAADYNRARATRNLAHPRFGELVETVHGFKVGDIWIGPAQADFTPEALRGAELHTKDWTVHKSPETWLTQWISQGKWAELREVLQKGQQSLTATRKAGSHVATSVPRQGEYFTAASLPQVEATPPPAGFRETVMKLTDEGAAEAKAAIRQRSRPRPRPPGRIPSGHSA